MEIVAMEITKEEMERIVRDRIETARKAEIDECAEVIRRALDRIEGLGGAVYVKGYGLYKSCAHCRNIANAESLDVRYN